MTSRKKIGFAGLGAMGRPMLSRLIDAGHDVTIYNRSSDKCEPFRARGVDIVSSAANLAAQSSVIITMLGTSSAVQEVVTGANGILAGAGTDLTLIDMSSTAPQTSIELAARCKDHGITMIDAPVAGTVRAATDGSLVIMAGGDPDRFAEIRETLSVLGDKLFHLGPNGAGCRMKLVVNILLSLTSQALAEALAFGAAQGLDLAKMHEVLVTTPSSSGVVVRKGKAMIDRSYAPAAPMWLLHKDLGQALAVAQDIGIPLPATATANSLYATGLALGHGEKDFSAIFAVMEHLLGADR